MKRSYLISLILLVLLQVLLFNHLHLFDAINPMIYLLFFMIYPFENSQTLLIGLSFLLGFLIDFLSQTGGAHTIATLTSGFLRPLIIRNTFGVTIETPQSFFSDIRKLNQSLFIIVLVAIHHFIYFILAYFSWNSLGLILKNTFLTMIFSLILMGVALSFYPRKK